MQNKFVKIRQIGDRATFGILSGRVEVSEKIDGANFSWKVNDDESLQFRSHNVVLGGGMEYGSPWGLCTTFVEEIHKRKPFKKGYVYFGECLVKPHRINYGKDAPVFIGFSILNVQYNIYIQNWKEIYEEYGIPTVPRKIFFNPKIEEIKSMVDGKSFLTPEIKREGIVLKNYQTQQFAKIVCDEFKETMKIKSKPVNEERALLDETPSMVEAYCTSARVVKKALEYCDETGKEMSMSIMKELINIVCDDILEEEILNIAKKYTVIDFKNFRKLVASKCAIILKTALIDGAN